MIRQTSKSNVYTVEAKSLDILCMGGFERELENSLQNANSHLFLDFSEVEEVSSAILGILLHKKMKMRKNGVEIYLFNVNSSIKRILKILNLSSLLATTNYQIPISSFPRKAKLNSFLSNCQGSVNPYPC